LHRDQKGPAEIQPARVWLPDAGSGLKLPIPFSGGLPSGRNTPKAGSLPFEAQIRDA
jgi:hypothetical protein